MRVLPGAMGTRRDHRLRPWQRSSGVIPPQPGMLSRAVEVAGDHNEGKEEKLGTSGVRSKLKLGEE